MGPGAGFLRGCSGVRWGDTKRKKQLPGWGDTGKQRCPHPLEPEDAAELPVQGSPSPAGAAALFGTTQPQNPWILPGDSRGNLLSHLTRTNTPHHCNLELHGPRDPGNSRSGSSRPRRPPSRFGSTEPRSGRGAESPGGGRAGKTWGQPRGDTDNPGGPWGQFEGAMMTIQRGHGDSSGLRWGHGDGHGDTPGVGGGGRTKSLGGTLGGHIREQTAGHSLPSPRSQPPARDPRYLVPLSL